MSIFFVGPSALEVWRAEASPGQTPSASKSLPQNCRGPRPAPPSKDELTALGIISRPVHLAVGSPGRRSEAPWQISHVMGNLPAGSFRRIAKDRYVASPEALVVQMAAHLPLASLTLMICEFCGTYSLDPRSPRGFREREPLTSTAAIGRYLERATGIHGAKKARRALSLAMDGSASPMESKLALLLCLPCSMGGYGIPRPLLNARIDIDGRAREITDRRYFKCDLYWPQARMAVEYDSDLEHSSETSISSDAKKRNALEAMGYLVITATKQQVFNPREFHRIAVLISRRLKRYRKSEQSMLLTRRNLLRQEILHDASQETLRHLHREMKEAETYASRQIGS